MTDEELEEQEELLREEEENGYSFEYELERTWR